MKKITLLFSLLALVVLIGALTGCDNRSQLEKDVDKAASDVKKALK